MSDKRDRPDGRIQCPHCLETLEPWHPAGYYDGEWMHLDCVTELMDEVGFDDFFGDN